jgi:mannosyltransferase OCH1-like enzyme
MHSHGGVYMDLDISCYNDMTPWLDGAQVVLQAEVGVLAH